MVQALINISDRSNRILNMVKAQHGFKNKSQAIDFVVEWYAKNKLGKEIWQSIYGKKGR